MTLIDIFLGLLSKLFSLETSIELLPADIVSSPITNVGFIELHFKDINIQKYSHVFIILPGIKRKDIDGCKFRLDSSSRQGYFSMIRILRSYDIVYKYFDPSKARHPASFIFYSNYIDYVMNIGIIMLRPSLYFLRILFRLKKRTV